MNGGKDHIAWLSVSLGFYVWLGLMVLIIVRYARLIPVILPVGLAVIAVLGALETYNCGRRWLESDFNDSARWMLRIGGAAMVLMPPVCAFSAGSSALLGLRMSTYLALCIYPGFFIGRAVQRRRAG